jgi:hypothetical protein
VTLRARYMFDMSAVANVTPPVADGMRFTDWALMVTGLERVRAAAEKAGG